MAPDSHSSRLPSLPASGHYANEDAPDQGGNLRISAKSGRPSRAQGGKSRREKKRERERERREPFARARLFIFRPISNYRGYERTRIRGGTDGKEEPEKIVRDRDSSLSSHVLSQFAVPRLSSLFPASLDRWHDFFPAPSRGFPSLYLAPTCPVETTSPTNVLRKNMHEDARTVVTCEASGPTSTPEGPSCCLIASHTVTILSV